ncbi:MAG: flippase [Ignavibacteriaceae bacterium]|nr:flippase [Ignavibacteriaceae bacterium]
MEESENSNITYSGKSIAKNTVYNLFGYGIPMVFALAIIPLLIKGLGEERFGILSLAWVVIGYFSFFDLGIGRALTKIIAEKIGTNKTEEVPGIFWTSFFLMLGVSVLGALVVFLFAPELVHKIFKISKGLQAETLKTFYILTLSIPIVTTTAGIRGTLEAYQKFGIINIIRTFLGVFSFLGPLLCLIFTNNLFYIVLFLVIIRIMVWILYITQCFKLNRDIKSKIYFESRLVKPILKLSGWMTVSNFIVPLIVYMDRFLIGALVSATAIAYYATPYEVISKLLIIPSALTGVLFPTFSASYLNNPGFTKQVSLKAIKYIFFLLYPVVLLIITFAHEGLGLWLGKNFAENSSLILQLLAAGVLVNSIAYIPFTFLEGIGRPDITAKIQLIEFPIYLFAMWIAIKQKGINGAAFIWLLRMLIDALILFLFAKKIISIHFEFKFKLSYLIGFLLIIASFFPVVIGSASLKLLLVTIVLITFSFISWKFFLEEEERMFLISRIKTIKY